MDIQIPKISLILVISGTHEQPPQKVLYPVRNHVHIILSSLLL